MGRCLLLAELRGVELDEELRASGIGDHEARLGAPGLVGADGPRLVELGAPDPGWTGTQLVESQVPDADPVGEPGRIGYLVERVHSECALCTRELEGSGETALDGPVVVIQIVDELALGGFGGDVAAVVDARRSEQHTSGIQSRGDIP